MSKEITDAMLDLKELARLLAEKEYPIAQDGPYDNIRRTAHYNAILPFLELLVEGKKWGIAHADNCHAIPVYVPTKRKVSPWRAGECTCGLDEWVANINAILDQH